VAAKEGLQQCLVPRVVWNIPNILVPTVAMAKLESVYPAMKKPIVALPVFTVISTACCIVGIYPAQAIFPQTAEIPVERAEPRFANLRDADGAPITRFFYNKGL
jgi:hypothetical protein